MREAKTHSGQVRTFTDDRFRVLPKRYEQRMSLNLRAAFRIVALLAAATGCAWGAGQYVDLRAFEKRNADAMAICGSLTPGMPISEAEGRSHAVDGAVVVTLDGRLVVRIPGQSLCVVETVGGRVRSAAAARNG